MANATVIDYCVSQQLNEKQRDLDLSGLTKIINTMVSPNIYNLIIAYHTV